MHQPFALAPGEFFGHTRDRVRKAIHASHYRTGRCPRVINPEVTWRREATFTMWHDCISFPWLLVRLRRHDSISLRYLDAGLEPKTWEKLARPESELLQHEIDHLDGVFAVDRALDRHALVSREVFDGDRARFERQVHYVIP